MRRSLVALFAAFGIAACDGFKEAMTAHVDVVARAGSQELSVERLSELLGSSRVIPAAQINADAARTVTGLWVNYHLLAQAAAQGDSLADPKLIDQAMWAQIAQARAAKWHELVMKKATPADTAAYRSRYNQGEVLGASHILLSTQGKAGAAKDSVRRRAETLRRQLTPGNFAEMAKRHSDDPGSKDRGGDYGVFPKGRMVAEFDKAILATQPGQLSPVFETQFGYHVVRRHTYDEVKDQLSQAFPQLNAAAAESTYLAKVEQSGEIKLRDNAVATARAVAKELDEHRDDKTVVATSKAGDLTAARLSQWIKGYPQVGRVQQLLAQAPDSIVQQFVKSIVRNELILQQADSAKIGLDSAETTQIRTEFTGVVTSIWKDLGIAPKTLSDSAKTAAERQRMASAHIEEYMDKLLAEQARFVAVPAPIETALRDKYEWKINDAGLDRAVQRAAKVRAALDSTRAAQRPQSQVPMGPARPGAPQQAQPQRPAPPAQRPESGAATPARRP
jgi:parvulin-like peptidyl-prolyl isomerase